MGSVKEKDERIVPTPEELEQGLFERRRRRADSEPDGARETKPRRGLTLFRGRGVGRRRKYVKVDRLRGSSDDRGEVEDSTQTQVPPAPESRLIESDAERSTEMRVRSVSLPTRRRKAPEPEKYQPYSKEAQFYEKATAKGHQMGALDRIPNSTNFEAVCERCGMRGELVVEFEENWSNLANHHFRGPAINRTCREPE